MIKISIKPSYFKDAPLKYDPNIHHRRSIRIKGYDYSQPNVYFVTVSTCAKEPFLGEVINGIMHLSEAGKILRYVWLDLPSHYPNVVLDTLGIIPDHFHAVIQLIQVDGIERSASLSEIVRALKAFSAKRINSLRKTPGQPVWQRNYYEHVIRDEIEWQQIRAYIDENPQRWEKQLPDHWE